MLVVRVVRVVIISCISISSSSSSSSSNTNRIFHVETLSYLDEIEQMLAVRADFIRSFSAVRKAAKVLCYIILYYIIVYYINN